jgi:hypothetical protein
MQALLFWVGFVLLLTGFFVVMVGGQWQRLGRVLLFFFAIKLDPEKGFWITIIGLAMFIAGSALFFLRI